MALFSAGSSLTYHLAPFVLNVKCDDNLSSFHTSSCGVPQGTVLGPLLFIMYTTPLSTPVSSLSLDYHLYADTQLFFSFHPLNFDSSISHLPNEHLTQMFVKDEDKISSRVEWIKRGVVHFRKLGFWVLKVTCAVWNLSDCHTSGNVVDYLRHAYTWLRKRTWLVILTVFSKMVGWSLTAPSTQFRLYRAFKVELYYKY